jgi:hypothetical protein
MIQEGNFLDGVFVVGATASPERLLLGTEDEHANLYLAGILPAQIS